MKLMDTEVVIDMLRRGEYKEGAISVLSLLETLRGLGSEKRGKTKELLEEAFEVVPLDNEVVEVYCRSYRALKSEGTLIPDADLIIGATALAHGMELVGREEHFDRLVELGLKRDGEE